MSLFSKKFGFVSRKNLPQIFIDLHLIFSQSSPKFRKPQYRPSGFAVLSRSQFPSGGAVDNVELVVGCRLVNTMSIDPSHARICGFLDLQRGPVASCP